MRDELAVLLERALALEVARERRRLVGLGDRAQREVHRPRRRRRGPAPRRRSAASKRRSSSRAQRQQRRLPLPALVHARQAAVVQLVAEVQRELEILVASGSAGVDGERHAQRGGTAGRASSRPSLSGPRGSGSASTRAAFTPARERDANTPGRRERAPPATRRARAGPRSAATARWRAAPLRPPAPRAAPARPRSPAAPPGASSSSSAAEPLARRRALARLEVGQHAVEAVAARRPAVLGRSATRRRTGSASPASWRAARPAHERVDDRRERRGLGDRGLRVRHAHLERAEGAGAGAAPTTSCARVVGRRAPAAAPRRTPPSSQRRRHALAGEQRR